MENEFYVDVEPSSSDNESILESDSSNAEDTYVETFLESYEEKADSEEEENEPIIVYEVNQEFNDSMISNLQLLNQSNDMILDNVSSVNEFFSVYETNSQIIYDELKQIEKVNHSILYTSVACGFLLASILGAIVAQYIITQFK